MAPGPAPAVLGAAREPPPRTLPPIGGRPAPQESVAEDPVAQQIRAIFVTHDPEGVGSIERRKIDAIFQRLQATPVFATIFTQEALEKFSGSGRFEYEPFLRWLYDDPGDPQKAQEQACVEEGDVEEKGEDPVDYSLEYGRSRSHSLEVVPNSPSKSSSGHQLGESRGSTAVLDGNGGSSTSPAESQEHVRDGAAAGGELPGRPSRSADLGPLPPPTESVDGGAPREASDHGDGDTSQRAIGPAYTSPDLSAKDRLAHTSPELAMSFRNHKVDSRPAPPHLQRSSSRSESHLQEADRAAEDEDGTASRAGTSPDYSSTRRLQRSDPVSGLNKIAGSPMFKRTPEAKLTPIADPGSRGKLDQEVHAIQEQKALFAAAIVLLFLAVLLVSLARLSRQFSELEPGCPALGEDEETPSVCESCGKTLNLLPLFGEYEQSWHWGVRAVLYFVGLLWIFQGIGEVCNEFMEAIEEITNSHYYVYRPLDEGKKTFKRFRVKVWNETVANLTLMALGSSAPEILLSVIEVIFGGFQIGELGAATIVSSAAFNLFVISAVCVSALPDGAVKKIGQPLVFSVTTAFSLFAYIWLIIILELWTPYQVTWVEALVTLMLFPAIVVCAYAADIMGKSGGCLRRFGGTAAVAPASPKMLVRTPSWSGHSLGDDDLDRKIPSLAGKNIPEATRKALREELRERERQLEVSPTPTQSQRRKMGTALLNGGTTPTTSLNLGDRRTPLSRTAGRTGTGSWTSTLSGVDEAALVFKFARREVQVLECEGKVKLTVEASRMPHGEVTVQWGTQDGTAKSKAAGVTHPRYVANQGVLRFRPDGPRFQEIEVEVIDDHKWQETEFFEVHLEEPRCDGDTARLEDSALGRTCTVRVLNDDRPGLLTFDLPEVFVAREPGRPLEAAGAPDGKASGGRLTFTLGVGRVDGADGPVSCKAVLTYTGTEAGSATSSTRRDIYAPQQVDEEVRFADGEASSTVKFYVDEHLGPTFKVELRDANPPVCLLAGGAGEDEISRGVATVCAVRLLPQRSSWTQSLFGRGDSTEDDATGNPWQEWKNKFSNAIYCKGEVSKQVHATYQDWLLHCVSLPWKVLFACVPPASFCGGKVAFLVALTMIGSLTAVIGDMATLLGCVLDIPSEITAATLVALGTSLPDTFASKIAAEEMQTADDAIGNITGSNSVNVFLGLGIPWTIAAFYWEAQGVAFTVPSGSLSFSVLVFTICALCCVMILVLRRRAYSGELGGPKFSTYRDSGLLLMLWVVYIAATIFKSLNLI